MFHDPVIGELSFSWNAELRRWLLLYADNYAGIVKLRVADQPWGPWSDPIVVFSNADGKPPALQAFMQPDGDCYAPYMIARYSHWDAGAGQATVYFTLSTWKPYQVQLMKTGLRVV